MTIATFWCPGHPQTKGSTRAFMPRGARFPIVTNDNPREKDWAARLALVAHAAMQGTPPAEGPVSLALELRLPRPKGHYGKQGLKPNAPRVPVTKPDWDKAARSIGDALTGICYRDDCQVVEAQVRKLYATDGEPGAWVTVATIP